MLAPNTSRAYSRALVFSCGLAFALLASSARADAIVSDPTKVPEVPAPAVADDGPADLEVTSLTPRDVAKVHGRPAPPAKAPWWSFSRLKGLIPSKAKLLSWLPGFKEDEPSMLALSRPPVADTKPASRPPALRPTNLARTGRPIATPAGQRASGQLTAPPIPAPEPGTWLVLGLGVAGLGIWSRMPRATGKTVRTG